MIVVRLSIPGSCYHGDGPNVFSRIFTLFSLFLLIWHSNGTCSFIAGIFLSNMGISITSLELESATLYPPHLSCSGSMRKGLSELSGATKPGLGEQPGGC